MCFVLGSGARDSGSREAFAEEDGCEFGAGRREARGRCAKVALSRGVTRITQHARTDLGHAGNRQHGGLRVSDLSAFDRETRALPLRAINTHGIFVGMSAGKPEDTCDRASTVHLHLL
jgi:hypothetical protein